MGSRSGGGERAHLTQLLEKWTEGDRSCEDELFGAVYEELSRVAGAFMRSERHGHTLEPAALVNEAYMKLKASEQRYVDRDHFFAVASRVMRRVLIDHARHKGAAKRGGGGQFVTLVTDLQAAGPEPVDLGRFEEALAALEQVDARKAELVQLRHLAGFSNMEIATHLGISERTIRRELEFARAFISRELAE